MVEGRGLTADGGADGDVFHPIILAGGVGGDSCQTGLGIYTMCEGAANIEVLDFGILDIAERCAARLVGCQVEGQRVVLAVEGAVEGVLCGAQHRAGSDIVSHNQLATLERCAVGNAHRDFVPIGSVVNIDLMEGKNGAIIVLTPIVSHNAITHIYHLRDNSGGIVGGISSLFPKVSGLVTLNHIGRM